MMLRRGTVDLEEINHGLTLEKLKDNPQEWVRLREFLLKRKDEME